VIFEKQEEKIGLLKINVAAIKTKEDLALLTADPSSMCAEVKAWHKAQCDIILAEMRPPLATSTTTPAPNPPTKRRNSDQWRRRRSGRDVLYI
jgi:hypothetical protein